ncbi:MAG: LamG domain-containing protein [Planctomycetota bacterium]|nr:MAG: LamG domain-containing protein [Planctomycetota bacterium]
MVKPAIIFAFLVLAPAIIFAQRPVYLPAPDLEVAVDTLELTDLNGDWIFNFEDFAVFSAFWLNQTCSDPNWCMGSDFDASGAVDSNDLSIFCDYWLTRIADPCLVAHWPLDENAANTFVADVSGNNHNGTATVDTSVLSAPGQVNTCFDFNYADAVSIVDHDAFSFTTGANDLPFSITAWVYVTTPGVEVNDIPQVIISKWDFDIQDKEWLLVIRPDLTLSLQLVDDDNSGVVKAKTSAPLSEGWHFVASTYDATGVGDGIALYVDGVKMPQTPSAGTYVRMRNTAADVYLGARIYAGINDYFEDRVDDLRLFSKCLTPTEVSDLYSIYPAP